MVVLAQSSFGHLTFWTSPRNSGLPSSRTSSLRSAEEFFQRHLVAVHDYMNKNSLAKTISLSDGEKTRLSQRINAAELQLSSGPLETCRHDAKWMKTSTRATTSRASS